jgi:hypothetical protein
MKNRFKYTKIKNFAAVSALIPLIVFSTSSTIISAFAPGAGYLSEKAFADDTAGTASALSIQKSQEALDYIKKIDTDQGRVDFQNYLNDKIKQKERLAVVRKNLAYQITQSYHLNADTSSAGNQDFNNPGATHQAAPENPTFGDLISRIKSEIDGDNLILKEYKSFNDVIDILKSNEAIKEIDSLEKKSDYENELTGLLEKKGDGVFGPLLSELRLDSSITEFLITYATTGQLLIERLQTYVAGIDTGMINDKLDKEQLILSYLNELYPTDADKATPLDEDSIALATLYFKEHIDQSILKYTNSLAQSDAIVSYLNNNKLQIADDLSSKTKYLEDVLAYARADRPNADSFKKSEDQLYDFMSAANQGDLDSNTSYGDIFGILKNFNFLLAYNTASAFDEIDGIKEEYSSVIDYEKFLRKAVDKLKNSAEETGSGSGSSSAQDTGSGSVSGSVQDTGSGSVSGSVQDTGSGSVSSSAQDTGSGSVSSSVQDTGSGIPAVTPETQPTGTQANPTETVTPTQPIPSDENAKPAAPVQDTGNNSGSSSAEDTGNSSGSAQDTKISDQNTVLTNQNTDLTNQNTDLTNKNTSLTDQNTDLTNQNTDLTNQNTDLTNKNTSLTNQNTDLTNQNADLKNQNTALGLQNSEPAVQNANTTDTTGNSPAAAPDQTNGIVVTEPAEEPVKDSVDVNLNPVIEEQDKIQIQVPETQEAVSAQNAQDIISLLQGQPVVSQEDDTINKLINENPDVIDADKAISDLDTIIKYGLLTTDIVNGIVASDITIDDFTAFLNKSNVTADDLDGLINFLNQLIVDLGYAPKTGEFSGVNGVIRFGSDKCSDVAAWQLINPLDETEDFPKLSKGRQSELQNTESEKQKDPEYSRFEALRNLNVDFCVQESTDITTKNLADLPDYTKLTTDDYKVDQSGIDIDFTNNTTRDISVGVINPSDTSSNSRMFTIKHTDPSTIAVADMQAAVGNAVKSAVSDKMGDGVVVEKIETVAEAPADAPSDVPVAPLYTMSALENPDQLFTPAQTDHEEDFKNAVTYESADHRKNIIEMFTDEAHSIYHRYINDYTVYNYGSGTESDTTVYDNTVLRKNADGDIEGYILPVVAPVVAPVVDSSVEGIYQNGLPTGPDFIIKAPFVLDKDSQIVDGFKYEITGDKHNQISYSIDAKADIYPMVLKSGTVFVSNGQTYFNQYADSTDGTGGRFGSAQATGDFNGDGYDDLAIGSYASDSNSGSVSIYFAKKAASNDAPIYRMDKPDVVIKGGVSSYFGEVLAAADFDGDGTADLFVGSPDFNDKQGKVWYFHGETLKDGFLEAQIADTAYLSADNADSIIEGAGQSDGFGSSILLKDLNKDGKIDLAVSSPLDRNEIGVVHIFYNSTIQRNNLPTGQAGDTTTQQNGDITAIQQNVQVVAPLKATDADIDITGEDGNMIYFGRSMVSADFDGDGSNDLAISASTTDSQAGGKVYLFMQNDTPWTNKDTLCQKNCSANNADSVISGANNFGISMATGDFNADSKADLAVGAPGSGAEDNSDSGSAYIFYQDETPWTNQDKTCVNCDAENADVKIIGQKGESFGSALLSADFNNDGTQDLAAGAPLTKSKRGGIYVFYSNPSSDKANIAKGGTISAISSHDVLLIGDYLSYFGYSLSSGDMNADKIADISVGAPGLDSYTGGAYVFYGQQSSSQSLHPANEKKPTEPTPEEKAKEALPTESAIPQDVTGFNLNPDEINQAVTDVQNGNQGYLLDISVPDKPVITCDGFTDGVSIASKNYASCSWTDTAGPSKGVYKYCTDSTNTCTPDTENPDRSVDLINLNNHHNYLRVQTSDEGGQSEIASFDMVIDNLPSIVNGPSDGGSDESNSLSEGALVGFSATAQDPEKDPYYLLVCRTNGTPAYVDGKLQCQGISDNSLCTSGLTDSGKEASCPFKIQEESSNTLIWYAFVCETQDIGGGCSDAFQGAGSTGSPLFIKHMAKHGQVNITNTAGGAINPGDRLLFTLPQKNVSFVPKDSKVTMYVCSSETTGFDYQQSQCIGGTMICASDPTNAADNDVICGEPVAGTQVVPAPSPAGENSVNVFVKYGVKGLVEGISAQKYNVEDVKPAIVSYTNTGDINIVGGGSTKVNFSAVIEDLNGSSDIQSAQGVFFDSDQVWNNCTPSRNDCYVDDGCALTKVDDTSVKADCTVEVFYNANASVLWKAHVNIINASGKFTDLPDSSDTRAVPPLSAINQEEITVPYDLALPGQIAGPVETVLTNLGNQIVDVLISGTDLTGKENNLPRELQKWSTKKDFNYDTEGYPLVETPFTEDRPGNGCANLSLPVHDDTKTQSVSIYWKIKVPQNQKADTYSGSVFFNPAPDTCVNN